MQLVILMLTFLLHPNPTTTLEFSYDTHGKIVFMEVVETNVGHDTLIINAGNISGKEGENTGKEIVFTKQSSFMLYNKRLTKVPDGQLQYKVQIQVKDNKYRYMISDLVFHEYERNRYGRFVAKRNGAIPVEEMLKESTKDWKSHKGSMLERFEKVIEKIKNQMVIIPVVEDKPSTVKLNDDW